MKTYLVQIFEIEERSEKQASMAMIFFFVIFVFGGIYFWWHQPVPQWQVIIWGLTLALIIKPLRVIMFMMIKIMYISIKFLYGFLSNKKINKHIHNTSINYENPHMQQIIYGYCPKCKIKRKMSNLTKINIKDGNSAIKGNCIICGETMYRIAGISRNHNESNSSEKYVHDNDGNLTFNKLMSFLEKTRIDMRRYIKDVYVCENFAKDLRDEAKKHNIDCSIVYLDLGNESGHMCNAFKTTDRGLIFIDATGVENPDIHRNMKIVPNVKIGSQYIPKQLFPHPGYTYNEQTMGTIKSIDVI